MVRLHGVSSADGFLQKGDYPMQNHQRVSEAFAFAAELHQAQARKVGEGENPTLAIPYITHLAEVFALVIQGFGDDDQMIAGLLHDAVEDQNPTPSGLDTAALIKEKFGQRVLDLVLASTDSQTPFGEEKAPWATRKTNHLTHLREHAAQDPSVLLVGLADKLSNGQAILNDLKLHGPIVWERFNAKPTQIAWYYESMLQVFQDFIPDNPLVPRLARVCAEMREMAEESTA